jgi:hypothetical protein
MSPLRSIAASASKRPKLDSRPGAAMVTRPAAKSTPTRTPPRRGNASPSRSSDSSRNSASAASLRSATLNVPAASDRTGQGMSISLKTGSTTIGPARPSTRPSRKVRMRLSAGRPGLSRPASRRPPASGRSSKRPRRRPMGTPERTRSSESTVVVKVSRPSWRSSRPSPLARPFQSKGMCRRASRAFVSASKRVSSSAAGSERSRIRPDALTVRPGPSTDRRSITMSSPFPERRAARPPRAREGLPDDA